jgi:hypothetical protein
MIAGAVSGIIPKRRYMKCDRIWRTQTLFRYLKTSYEQEKWNGQT